MSTQTFYASAYATIGTDPDWTNPTYAYADDANYASGTTPSKNYTLADYYSFGTAIGTAVAANANLNTVRIEVSWGAMNSYANHSMNLQPRASNGGSAIGTGLTVTPPDTYPTASTLTCSPTVAQLRASTFGTDVKATRGNSNSSDTYRVQYVRVYVDWTVPTTYMKTGNGGMTTGGTATRSRLSVYTKVPTGGMATGGVATKSRLVVRRKVGAGGLTAGGTATFSYTPGVNTYTATVSGGMVSGGAATLARLVIKTVVPTGGLVSGGAGSWSTTKTAAPSGGLVAGGAAVKAAIRLLHPSGTFQQAGWTGTWADIDEAVPSDADYVESPDATDTPSEYIVRVDAVATPLTRLFHNLRYRYLKNDTGGDTVNLTVRWVEIVAGVATTRGTPATHTNIGAVTEGAIPLSEAEANAITDYSQLAIGFSEVKA